MLVHVNPANLVSGALQQCGRTNSGYTSEKVTAGTVHNATDHTPVVCVRKGIRGVHEPAIGSRNIAGFCISKSELQKPPPATGDKVQQFPVPDLPDILPPTESLVRNNLGS
jgi:hypothetical protein